LEKDGNVLTELAERTPLTNRLAGHFLVFSSFKNCLEIRHHIAINAADPLTLKCIQTVPNPF